MLNSCLLHLKVHQEEEGVVINLGLKMSKQLIWMKLTLYPTQMNGKNSKRWIEFLPLIYGRRNILWLCHVLIRNHWFNFFLFLSLSKKASQKKKNTMMITQVGVHTETVSRITSGERNFECTAFLFHWNLRRLRTLSNTDSLRMHCKIKRRDFITYFPPSHSSTTFKKLSSMSPQHAW